jgi:branched-chain amino acid transport system permease protein
MRESKRVFGKYMAIVAILLFCLGFPIFVRDQYLLHVAIMTLIYGIFASSLNIVLMTGQMSIAHAAFYGIGAYTSALLVKEMGLNFWLALPLSALVAMVFGLFVGWVTLRLKSHYFAICTFAFGELVVMVMDNWEGLTHGPIGIRGIPGIDPLLFIKFETRTSVYYLMLVMLVLTTFLFFRLRYSRVGRAFMAIREDDEFAKAIGIHLMGYKLIAFLVGTCFAGLAGSFYAHYIKFISPHAFSVMESINVLIVLLIGGIGFLAGPIVGSIFNQLVPEVLHVISEYRMIVYGIITVLVIIYMPTGITGLCYKVPWDRMKKRFIKTE